MEATNPRTREDLEKLEHSQVDFIGKAEMIGGSLLSEYAESMSVVHNHKGPVGLGEFDELRKFGDVAFHGVHAFQHEEFGGCLLLVLEDFPKVAGVIVGEAFAGRSAQLNAAPERGVQVLVGEDPVLAFGKSGDRGGAGEVTGGKDVAGFLADEVGEFFLQSLMKDPSAIGQTGSGGSRTPLPHGFDARFPDLGMPGKSKVIVA